MTGLNWPFAWNYEQVWIFEQTNKKKTISISTPALDFYSVLIGNLLFFSEHALIEIASHKSLFSKQTQLILTGTKNLQLFNLRCNLLW